MKRFLPLLLLTSSAFAQQIYTGVIKDLTGQVVTSGQVTFTLTLPNTATIPGVGTFVPTTTLCNINADGTLSGYVSGAVSGACTVVPNISLTPTGTAYRICEQPYYTTPGSCFYDYALGGSKDISSVVPTLPTGPINYGGVQGPPIPFLGTWNSATVYTVGQAVSFGNTVYISLTNPNLNNNPASSSANWSGIVAPASLISAPTTTQTVVQPSGTTFQATSINGAINATLMAGSEIGAKVNAAIARIGCGEVLIPAGTYTQTTTIIKPRCITLRGQGDGGTGTVATVLNWTPSTGVAVNVADPNGTSNYPGGGIDDLAFVGPGNTTTTIGLYLGGDLAGAMSPSTAYGDHQNFDRIGVTGFGKGLVWGNNAWSQTFHESLINGNGTGVDYSSGTPVNSGESIAFVNTSIQNNTIGIVLAGYSDFYFTNSRCDYNSKCATVGGAAQAYFKGMHFEQLGGVFLTFAGSIDQRGFLSVEGSSFVSSDATGSDADMVEVTAGNYASVSVHDTWLFTAHPVTSFLNWGAIAGVYPTAMLRLRDIHFAGFAGNFTNLVNTCAFAGCYIDDMSTLIPAQSLTLINGWTTFTGSGDPPAATFIKDGNSVYLSGRLNPASSTSSQFATLPAGYRPAFNQHIAIEGGNGSTVGTCELFVSQGGALIVQPSSCATVYASLDGVVFRVQ